VFSLAPGRPLDVVRRAGAGVPAAPRQGDGDSKSRLSSSHRTSIAALNGRRSASDTYLQENDTRV